MLTTLEGYPGSSPSAGIARQIEHKQYSKKEQECDELKLYAH